MLDQNPENLVLALPSKGRLQELSVERLAKNGLIVQRPGGDRSYLGTIDEMADVTIRFLSASEISRELVRGNIHLGVTGADLVHEVSELAPEQVEFILPLEFGHADVIIAIPDAWIDVTHMRDLSDVAADFATSKMRWMRIATKYINLTRGYFRKFGIAEYKIVESLGATEAAPAAGTAELIVDITSTGSTLRANGLRVLEDGVILKSQAHLLRSKTASFSQSQSETLARLKKALGV